MAGRAAKNNSSTSSGLTPRLLNVQQAAAFLGTTVWFMRKLAWGKRIAYIHLGKRLLFDVRDLESFIASQKIPACA
jgi:hypothetical protein